MAAARSCHYRQRRTATRHGDGRELAVPARGYHALLSQNGNSFSHQLNVDRCNVSHNGSRMSSPGQHGHQQQ